MGIFDSLKNPFKDCFIKKRNRTLENKLKADFYNSINQINIIAINDPEKAINLYTELLKVAVLLDSSATQNLLIRLIACCSDSGKIGDALYFNCLCSLFAADGAAVSMQLEYLFNDFKNKGMKNLEANKKKVSILTAVQPRDKNIDFIRNVLEEECFQEIVNFQNLENYFQFKGEKEFHKINIVMLSTDIFNTEELLIKEYDSLRNTFPQKDVYIFCKNREEARLIMNKIDVKSVILHYDFYALCAVVLRRLEKA